MNGPSKTPTGLGGLQLAKRRSPNQEGIAGRKRSGPRPLSFAQERLWFLDQYEPDSPLYNVALALRMRGSLDVEALQLALNAIVARHEVLRTTYTAVQGEPVQVIRDQVTVELPLIDLSGLRPGEREAEVERLNEEEGLRPFDLTRDLMIRAKLVRIRAEEHALLLNFHHIAFDGWSKGILFRELGDFYRAYLNGHSPSLPDLPIQYTDYACWQRERLQGEALDEQLSYWRQQLEGIGSLQPFPTDHPRPERQTYRRGRAVELFPEGLPAALEQLSKSGGASLFMTLLAGIQALVHRYTRSEDAVVGTPIANRNRLETENLIGFFVNTLVLRTNLRGEPSFRELLRRVRDVALEAYDHQDLPFEKLVQALQPERSLNHTPLFQIMFTLENAPMETLELPGLTVTEFDSPEMPKFDLFFRIRRGRTLQAECIYNRDLFEPGTVKRALGHYFTLLESATREPDKCFTLLPMLTRSEQTQLLVEWNDTRKEYPQRCVEELFEAQAKRAPDAVAIVYKDRRVSYDELNRRANRLAALLREAGVGPEEKVGLYVERSPEMVVGLLGILKAGAAYVPLDPAYPAERLGFMLRDAGVRVVVMEARRLEALPQNDAKTVCLDRLPDPGAEEEAQNPPTNGNPDRLAYVMYTSGSTGEPKGVEITHRGIVRLLFGVDYVRLDENEVLLQAAPISFDASTFEIWGALLHGGCLVIFPGSVPTAPELGELIRQERISTLWLTASLFTAILDEDPEALRPVRQLITGGEAVPVASVRTALGALPDTELIDGYGPTEGTTFTCCYRLPRDFQDAASVPIGRPIGNTQVYILDPRLQPVPIGVPGELYIGGDGLGRGYLNQPTLTQEKFIPDPFNQRAGARLYRTGDLARYRADGNIEFLGRLDDQVKIRGFRVELGEVEEVLARHPLVKSAAASIREDAPGGRALVAYLVAGPKENPAAGELRAFLKQRLPDYMIPQRFVFLERLPLLASGKVDRLSLPAPEASSAPEGRELVKPRDAREARLLKIWQGVLGTRSIGVGDNFFELGGHSLLAAKLLARIEQEFGRRLSMITLFAAPTIEQLAAALRDSSCRAGLRGVAAIQPLGSKPPFFCVGAGPLFLTLARHLDSDQPLLGLGLEPGEAKRLPRPYRVEDIAGVLVKKLRAAQPKGPYLLGGWCLSGVLAYEMARQLGERGEAVRVLALFDPPNPMELHSLENPMRPAILLERLRVHLADLRHLKTRELAGYLLGLSNGLWLRIERVILVALSKPHRAGSARLQSAENIIYVAASTYRPRPYAGRATLFRSTTSLKQGLNDDALTWGTLVAGGLEVHHIPGDHRSILKDPAAATVARSLTDSMARMEKDGEQVAQATSGRQ
jgi:amino acid adenylation domain-containing protein